MNLRLIRRSIVVALVAASFNSSATVTLEKYKDTSEVTIRIHNQIIEEDLVEFKNTLESIEKEKKVLHMNAVQLNSMGGNGSIGRKIGTIIREKKLYTYVAPKSICESACVYILMGGVVRYPFGEVGVHRTTYGRGVEVDDNLTESFVRIDIQFVKEYSTAMGMTRALTDAILNTESWKIRTINDVEKREWQVFGTDRAYEERLFTSIAKALPMDRSHFVRVFSSNYEDCLKEARRFERSAYECAKTKQEKRNYWNEIKTWIFGAYSGERDRRFR